MNDPQPYDIGIDVGALNTKILVLRDAQAIAGKLVRATTMEPEKLAKQMIEEIENELGIRHDEIRYIVATGQGRKAIRFANMARTEITAFAKGAFFLDPAIEVVVDIGGQGIRVMKLGELGIVADFKTNDKCSSGTGCFIDTMAVALEVGIENVGELSLAASSPERISTTCTVFAESEVVSLVAKGRSKEDILAGLNLMVARKIRAMITSIGSRAGTRGPVLLAGGVAMNTGIVRNIEEKLDRELIVPPEPQYLGALGAALMAPRPRPREADDDEAVEDESGADPGAGMGWGLFKRMRHKKRMGGGRG